MTFSWKVRGFSLLTEGKLESCWSSDDYSLLIVTMAKTMGKDYPILNGVISNYVLVRVGPQTHRRRGSV